MRGTIRASHGCISQMLMVGALRPEAVRVQSHLLMIGITRVRIAYTELYSDFVFTHRASSLLRIACFAVGIPKLWGFRIRIPPLRLLNPNTYRVRV
jgi:hypothetical protein